jgi:competence protein ComEC
MLAARGIAQARVHAGMRLEVGSGATIDVMHPPRGLVPGAPAAGNDNSLVLKVRYHRISLLLTGDLEEAGVPVLLAAPDGQGSAGDLQPLRATILKVPHHGSRLGPAGERFFRYAAPAVSIISVGQARHLPAAETLAQLRGTGTTLYSTATDGMIRVRTNGSDVRVTTHRTKRRQVIQAPPAR